MGSVLIVGGGVAGIQAALDLAEQGIDVYLVDKAPSVGGKMAYLDKTFPTLDCASCILAPKMAALLRYPNIKLIMYSEVQEVSGRAGNFKVKILRKPTYVDWSKCNGCGVCTEKCPTKVPNEYNMGLSQRRAIYIMFPQAVPKRAVIDAEHCMRLNPPPKAKEKAKGPLCGVCERNCPTKAIRYDQQPEIVELNVDAIIIATGMELYDPRNLPELGYGKHQNVYTNLEFERLVSATGPTNGEIVRKSDGKHPKRIAWIQCVGSRDVRFNHYCSAYCCMAATKQAILAKEHLPDVDCTVYYMDIRAFGKGFNEFVERAKKEFGVRYIRGKVVRIDEIPETKNLKIVYEDTAASYLKTEEYDMVVLSMAVRPNSKFNFPVELTKDGFVQLKNPYLDPVSTTVEGIFVVGAVAGAKDIPDSVTEASAAAARAALIAKRLACPTPEVVK
ncbi:MAG: CoB--CoM heterodisulfide reductase iron-sulfur subunit A family protein [Archaeoglobales archaeon]|nr:CoB--CoM heterodisulfide reductase iron-sulfur subunit A family protein [Archaeoglobales archaeon]